MAIPLSAAPPPAPTAAAAPAALRPLPSPRRAHLFRVPQDQPIFALDVSKKTLVGALYDPTTARFRNHEAPNTPAGVQRLLTRIPAQACWVLEPTGRYSNLAVDLAREAGRAVLMAEPRRAKSFLQSGETRAKTDRLDSRGLAEFAAARALPLYPRPTPVMEQSQQLLSARRGLSQALSRLHQQQRELPHAAVVLATACAALQAQLKAVDTQLAELVAAAATEEEPGAAARLDAVPGIGPVTAAAAANCLQGRHFSHPDQFVAYIGLDLTVRDSGEKQGKQRLSHRGDGELRRLLYVAAQANLRCRQSPFRQQYERERAKGLSHTAATCAVARKLAKVCWSLVKHGTKYQAERVHQQPPPGERPALPETTPLPALAALPGAPSELTDKLALDSQP
jgi:transposase